MIEVCCGQVKWKASQSYKVRCLMVSRSRQERGLMCFHVLVWSAFLGCVPRDKPKLEPKAAIVWMLKLFGCYDFVCFS